MEPPHPESTEILLTLAELEIRRGNSESTKIRVHYIYTLEYLVTRHSVPLGANLLSFWGVYFWGGCNPLLSARLSFCRKPGSGKSRFSLGKAVFQFLGFEQKGEEKIVGGERKRGRFWKRKTPGSETDAK